MSETRVNRREFLRMSVRAGVGGAMVVALGAMVLKQDDPERRPECLKRVCSECEELKTCRLPQAKHGRGARATG